MSKRAMDDPWCDIPTETVDVGGVKVDVRGLTYGEITALAKQYEKDTVGFSRALICACCTRRDGGQITPESLGKFRASIVTALDAAVGRVNGASSGNSSATGADDSFSA